MKGWRAQPGRLAAIALLVALALFAIIKTDDVMRANALVAEEEAAMDGAAILASSLSSELDKFSLLPLALAEDPQVKALVAGDRDAARALDRRLETLASQSDAAAIYVMDAQGLTLAASNHALPTSFVNSNYAFRSYFREAMDKGSSTQFALGTVSRKPGLYIAARVGPSNAPSGVVAVKVEFDRTEENWRRATRGVYVTDREGVVLLTSEEAWRFHLTGSGPAAPRDPAEDLRQFGIAELPRLELPLAGASGEIVQVPLVEAQQAIGPAGWDIHLIVDPGPRVAAALATGRLILVSIAVVVLAIVFALFAANRRRRAHEEAVVAQRTRTLREQLSQANRLATLGQISAGVNHEIGQPVSAIRVFAESGSKLVAAGKTSQAAQNFGEIVSLADRIGAITSELRRFGRRQPGEKRIVAIGEIIDGALLLLRDRIHSHGRDIDLPEEDLRRVTVEAEHVRLEQVLVNLLQNALDATDFGGRIAIEIALLPDAVHLHVVDEGHGIPAASRDTLFHPFATSKDDGLGLGLVIARDIMRDLSGDLVFDANRQQTTFTMIIPRHR